MKVLLICLEKEFGKNTGKGPARTSYEIYNNIKNLASNEDKIEILKIKIPKVFGSGNSFLGNILFLYLKSLFITFKDYDIIYLLNYNIFIRRPTGKVISLVNDLRELNILEPYIHKIFKYNKFYSYVVKNVAKLTLKSDYIIAISTQTKEELIRAGYNKKNIFVVNIGINKTFFKPKTIADTNTEFIIGYIGSFDMNKNVKFAIESIKLLNGVITNFTFNLYGNINKSFYAQKFNYIKDKNIKFMGFAPEKKLIDIYDSFDVFVFPSLYEGFGLPIIEAQARGLPVIIYKYGKIPKEVRKYCFEAESPEHMAQIIEDLKENGYNEKLRKKATEYARSFTWEKTAKETLKIFKKVLS
ncbi:MAG: glycosyltransferase [Candidatus Micrarchaeaceae archaeon]